MKATERPRDPNLLASGLWPDADTPADPMRARDGAGLGPRLVGVEHPKPREQSVLGDVDPRSECGDLFPERLELLGGHFNERRTASRHVYIMQVPLSESIKMIAAFDRSRVTGSHTLDRHIIAESTNE